MNNLESYLKDQWFFFQTSMGEKKSASPPRVLNPRPCTRTLCKCVTPGQGGLWLWVQQFFSFICVYSCYCWPSLAPATVPQHCNSQTSSNDHIFIAAGFSVSLRPTVHTFTRIWTFLQGNAHGRTSQTTKMTSLQRPVNQTSDKQFIQNTMLYCKSSQKLIRTPRCW